MNRFAAGLGIIPLFAILGCGEPHGRAAIRSAPWSGDPLVTTDGKALDRWAWLVDHGVTAGETPFDRTPAERLHYIDGFTAAMREKVDIWKRNSDCWWSPLLGVSAATQAGYFAGHQAADDVRSRFTETGLIGRDP